jgi:hypothetical protein
MAFRRMAPRLARGERFRASIAEQAEGVAILTEEMVAAGACVRVAPWPRTPSTIRWLPRVADGPLVSHSGDLGGEAPAAAWGDDQPTTRVWGIRPLGALDDVVDLEGAPAATGRAPLAGAPEHRPLNRCWPATLLRERPTGRSHRPAGASMSEPPRDLDIFPSCPGDHRACAEEQRRFPRVDDQGK